MERIIRTLAGSLLALLAFIPVASAQTTVVLDAPDTQVVDAFIRGGNYANQEYDTSGLVTKANKTASYVRRTLLRFNTQDFVPANTTIQSATLTLTLKSSETDTRTLGAYRLTRAFHEPASNWYQFTSSDAWTTPGGDFGGLYAQATVGTTPGARVTFDLTRLVQESVNGVYGSSRWTRVALVDGGPTSAASYKEFHSSEASDPSVRPQLVVVYGDTPPPPPPAPSSTSTLKVLHWNIHYGFGTDGAYGIDKHVNWIVRINPDVVSLNEVEKNVAGHGNEDQPALFAAKLTALTGQQWYYHHAQRYGNWGANGGGNLILSRFPIEARSQLAMSYNRSAALVTITVNGRTINFISTHLASESSSYREVQIRQLMSWARGFSEQRVVAGDFNAGLSNIPYMASEYDDGWTAAGAIGVARDYPGNYRAGSTFINGYRIDFVFESDAAQALTIRAAQVFDTRDANGVMPSDHKPLLVTYNVQ